MKNMVALLSSRKQYSIGDEVREALGLASVVENFCEVG